MSGRCKACNEILDDFEMIRIYPGTDQYDDLCIPCRNKGEDDYDYDPSVEDFLEEDEDG